MKLITGASGLIGKALMNPGDLGVDIIPSAGVQQCDFRNVEIPDKVTAVYHMAGLSRVHQVDDMPELAIALAKDLHTLITKSGPDRLFVLASSKEVLGDTRNATLDSPFQPKSLYAELKAYQEKVAHQFIEKGWPVKIVRFSTVYGDIARDYQTRVIPSFVRSALNNEPLVVKGPEKLLEPTNLKVVRNLVQDITTDSSPTTILGSGQPVTLLELAQIVVDLTGSRSTISLEPASSKHGDFSSLVVRPEFDLIPQLQNEIIAYRNSLGAF